MLKIVLITETPELNSKIEVKHSKIVASVAPGKSAIEALARYNPDLVITSSEIATRLNSVFVKSLQQPRANVIAKTHQGVQLVPIIDIYYFQADDKYVIAYHQNGELLIEDSIVSLETEFANEFLRIHRKTLVAIKKIETLLKNDAGQYFIKLKNTEVELAVSRRQLPLVRKILKCL